MARIEDIALGTLIDIDELHNLTQIPKPTIRTWRRPEYAHLAKFDAYDHPSTKKVWYRLADVEGWLVSQGLDPKGNRSMFSKREAPNAVFRAPLGATGLTPRQHQIHQVCAPITMDNIYPTLADIATKWQSANPIMADVRAYLGEIVPLYYELHNLPTPDDLTVPGYALLTGKMFWDEPAWAALSDEDKAIWRERHEFQSVALARFMWTRVKKLDATIPEVCDTLITN